MSVYRGAMDGIFKMWMTATEKLSEIGFDIYFYANIITVKIYKLKK